MPPTKTTTVNVEILAQLLEEIDRVNCEIAKAERARDVAKEDNLRHTLMILNAQVQEVRKMRFPVSVPPKKPEGKNNKTKSIGDE